VRTHPLLFLAHPVERQVKVLKRTSLKSPWDLGYFEKDYVPCIFVKIRLNTAENTSNSYIQTKVGNHTVLYMDKNQFPISRNIQN
jgi:hypothetical protein